MENQTLMEGFIRSCNTSMFRSEKGHVVSLQMILQDTNRDLHRLNITFDVTSTSRRMECLNNAHDVQTAIINHVLIQLISHGADGVVFKSVDIPDQSIPFLTIDWSFI